MMTDYGRHPKFSKKNNVEQIANLVRCWPGNNYSVSSCRLVRTLSYIPISINVFFKKK